MIDMKWHRELNEFLASMAGAFVAIAIILTLRAWLAGAKETDWLNFAGVIFGVTLTIGGTKVIDTLLVQARRRRRREDFAVAVRAIALCLIECTEAATAEALLLRTRTVQSLWRVAEVTIDQLPDLNFEHRAKIGIMQDGLNSMIPQLASYGHIATTSNPELFVKAQEIARISVLTVLPVTDLFGERMAVNERYLADTCRPL